MASTDGLLLLRSALSAGQELPLLHFPTPPPTPLDPTAGTTVHTLADATHILFPSSGAVLAKGTPTRWLLQAGSSESYALDALLYAFAHRDDSVADYLRHAREIRIDFVTVTDRRIVLDWLAGRSAIEGPPGRIRPLEDGPVAAEAGAAPSAKRSAEEAAAAGAVLEGEAVPAAKKGRYRPDQADLDKLKQLQLLTDGPLHANILPSGVDTKGIKSGGVYSTRETVLRGDRTNTFDSVRQLAAPRLKALYEAEKTRQRASGGTAAAPAAVAGAASGPARRKNNQPIIIISPSSTALITMHNVKQFLEDSHFVESDEARRIGGGSTGRTEDVLQVHHARANVPGAGAGGVEPRKARYFVVDSVEALAKFGGIEEAWERVVCVMTTGQEWQFRPYKWSDPKDLFHHVKGIHVQWLNDKPNPKVRNWNCTELRIDKAKRHRDYSTVASFWESLEKWITMNKPWLQI